jgi:hypothetical protein
VKNSLFALALALAACGGASANRAPASAPAPTTLSPAQIAEKTTPSIVLIKTDTTIGTGFVVWKDGRIATNLHVIAGAHTATVKMNDGRSFDEVYVLGVDQVHDLAVIRIAADDLKPLTLGDSAAVKAGEHVVAIGNPMGLGNTVSDGLVSAVRVLDPKLTLLQISAPIAPGSSGGPILNERAEVIGVATLYSAEGQNLNFGVPVAYLKPLLLAEKATPLSAFSQLLDVALFEGCSGEEVKLVVTEISDAIKVGVPLYNGGNEQGCYDVYEKASLKLVGALKSCPAVRETLLGGLSNANHVQKPGEKAWALRHSFDRVLNAFETAVKAQEQERPRK